MSLISITIKLFTALGNSEVVIVTTGGPYIKKIRSSFTSPDTFAVNAFYPFFIVVFVRHSCNNFQLIEMLVCRMCYKYNIVLELAKFENPFLALILSSKPHDLNCFRLYRVILWA